MKTFGETLNNAIKEKGINQKELSGKSGVAQSYISRLVNGVLKDPTFTKACAIIDALGMTLDEFAKLQDQED